MRKPDKKKEIRQSKKKSEKYGRCQEIKIMRRD